MVLTEDMPADGLLRDASSGVEKGQYRRTEMLWEPFDELRKFLTRTAVALVETWRPMDQCCFV